MSSSPSENPEIPSSSAPILPSSAPVPPPKPKKRRRAITDVERKDLRLRNATGPNSQLLRKALQDWSFQKCHHWLAESTLSESLGGGERAYETVEDDTPRPRIKDSEAILLLERLQLYEEQQADGDEVFLSCLGRYGREIRARGASKQQQASISGYFT